jgi:hypothetical protein
MSKLELQTPIMNTCEARLYLGEKLGCSGLLITKVPVVMVMGLVLNTPLPPTFPSPIKLVSFGTHVAVPYILGTQQSQTSALKEWPRQMRG